MTAKTVHEKTLAEQTLIVVGLVALAGLLLTLLYFIFDVLLLIFAAILLAIFIRGLAGLLGKVVKIPEGWRVASVSLIFVLVIVSAVALLSPSVAEQIGHLREQLPESARQAAEYVSQYRWGKAIIDQLPSTSDVVNVVGSLSFISGVGGVFSSTIGAIGDFFIAVLLALYFSFEPRMYANGFIKLFPLKARGRVGEILDTTGETLWWWLIGKAGSMLFIGLLTWIGLSVLGVPLALTLGLFTGLLSFIPNFGPILSAIPSLLLGFIISPATALYVLILYIVVQLIESNVVTPLIERETIELPPALTIMFQLGLAVLVGGLGLVLATPLLAVIMVLVEMVYIQDVLGDRERSEIQQKGFQKE
jgi:predicted PurR-regulated permease PerM